MSNANGNGKNPANAKRKQVNISTYFNKKHILSEQVNKTENLTIPIPCTSQLSENDKNTACSIEKDILEPLTFIEDIGYYINSKSLNQNTRYRLVKKNWLPGSDFIFPFSTHVKKDKEVKRYLNQSHLMKFPWLVYSSLKSGLFCKFCVLFLVNNTGGLRNTEPLKKLVTVPLNTFAKLLGKDGDLESHQNNLYHKNAILQANEFLIRYEQPEREVLNLIDSERKRQIVENRERITPIIESIIFLARQNIPLRGHRDDGELLINSSSKTSVINEGNFRELLRFRIKSGDKILENHLNTTHAKATYISNTIQEELIECCKEEIIYKILTDIQCNKFNSILLDETTDVSHSSQMTLILRYIFDEKIKEDFVSFINCHTYFYNKQKSNQEEHINHSEECVENYESTIIEPKLTGEVLGKIVVNILKSLNLNLKHCVGIATDGCSIMTSTVRGAVKYIQSNATPNAVYSPCTNHCLNLSISKSSSVMEIRDSIGIIKETVKFFNMSAKRNHVLKIVFGKEKNLMSLCETRWIERHDSVLIFKNSLHYIIKSLNLITEWQDNDSSVKAYSLLNSLTTCQFIISLFILSDLLNLTSPASKLLPSVQKDLHFAEDCFKDIINIMENRRSTCYINFKTIFIESKQLMEKLDVEVKLPRITKHQIHRPNINTLTVEEYFRISVYNPLYDHVLADLKDRYLKKRQFSSELDLWITKWTRVKNEGGYLPSTVIDGLNCCPDILFPSIKTILLIIGCLPISIASAERSFSSLRRLKNWLRSRMSQDRLNGLALLYVHRDKEVLTDSVIERFSKVKKRNIEFIL
ncbi:52 kDa repressor of the inhibitor of the protein kinase-like isoform X2 [Hydra vulgaris]|uniref:52 kDa repressor of the inhibitor of the protein kinase-like isoform X2 n=1 Tax=Hydra vulgaris TaxID=6087 RepID=A0ABM4CEP7_HYDVU